MKNKNIVLLILVVMVFLLGVAYFLGTQQNKIIVDTSNVSTTTDPVTGDSVTGTTTTTTTTNKIVPKKIVTVPTSNYIGIGQRTLINSVYVTPIKVAYDSRCPKDVQCIQAGSLDLGVLLESGSLSQNVIITSGKPFTFAGKVVTLTSILPTKVSTKTIGESEYRFLITVKK